MVGCWTWCTTASMYVCLASYQSTHAPKGHGGPRSQTHREEKTCLNSTSCFLRARLVSQNAAVCCSRVGRSSTISLGLSIFIFLPSPLPPSLSTNTHVCMYVCHQSIHTSTHRSTHRASLYPSICPYVCPPIYRSTLASIYAPG